MGGAAAFAAAHEYEEYCKKRGEPVTHAGFKEAWYASFSHNVLLVLNCARVCSAGLIGAFVDREAETKGVRGEDLVENHARD